VDPDYAPGARTAFTDGFPLLLIGEGSLADLNARLPSPVSMRRFRPNLVIAGSAPYAEDGWRRIRIGALTFQVVKPCSRCVVTTVDPDTGLAEGPEPLRTLATYRRRDPVTVLVVGAAVVQGEQAVVAGAEHRHLSFGRPHHPSPARGDVLQSADLDPLTHITRPVSKG